MNVTIAHYDSCCAMIRVALPLSHTYNSICDIPFSMLLYLDSSVLENEVLCMSSGLLILYIYYYTHCYIFLNIIIEYKTK